ncbi:hypothetical protein ACO0QE_000213 [Hanseniaspora vineae]
MKNGINDSKSDLNIMQNNSPAPSSPLIKSTNPINLLKNKNAISLIEKNATLNNTGNISIPLNSHFQNFTSGGDIDTTNLNTSPDMSNLDSLKEKDLMDVDMDVDMDEEPMNEFTQIKDQLNTNISLDTQREDILQEDAQLEDSTDLEFSATSNTKAAHEETGSGESHVCEMLHPTTKAPCLKSFSRPYDLIRHQKTIHAPMKKIFRCLFCIESLGAEGYKKTFSRGDALSRHIKVKHNLKMDDEILQNAMKFAKENVEFVSS